MKLHAHTSLWETRRTLTLTARTLSSLLQDVKVGASPETTSAGRKDSVSSSGSNESA